MDEWNSISSDTPPNSATDAWDAVSTPGRPSAQRRQLPPDNLVIEDSLQSASLPDQAIPVTPPSGKTQPPPLVTANPSHPPNRVAPGLRPLRRRPAPGPSFRKTALAAVIALLLVTIILFLLLYGNVIAVRLSLPGEQARATALAIQANATATAQFVATATASEQMYVQDTSGIPAIEDPLSDNNKGYAWGVLTFNFGGSCWFTGKDYHLAITNSASYWMWCAGRGIPLNNFAFQVQERMLKPGDAGIVFGYTANGFYRMDVGSGGTFTLYQYTENNKQTQVVQSGTSSAIKSGLHQANIMTLDVHNGNLYFYVNSQFVMNTNLSAYGLPYKPGTFGFAAANFGQPTEVVYTNLKVWML